MLTLDNYYVPQFFATGDWAAWAEGQTAARDEAVARTVQANTCRRVVPVHVSSAQQKTVLRAGSNFEDF